MVIFNIDWVQVLGLVLGIILPLIVAIVTKLSTLSAYRAILLAALALVTNLLTQLQFALVHNTVYNLGSALLLGLGTFIVAVAVHYGIYEPTGVSTQLVSSVGRTDKGTVTHP